MNRTTGQKERKVRGQEIATRRTELGTIAVHSRHFLPLTCGVLLACVLFISGCATMTVRDFYPNQSNKGYALISSVMPSGYNFQIPVYQKVNDTMKYLGVLGSTIIASAPPGTATFYFNKLTCPISFDIYECKTTRVEMVFSSPVRNDNGVTFQTSFQANDPVKGKIRLNQLAPAQRPLATAAQRSAVQKSLQKDMGMSMETASAMEDGMLKFLQEGSYVERGKDGKVKYCFVAGKSLNISYGKDGSIAIYDKNATGQDAETPLLTIENGNNVSVIMAFMEDRYFTDQLVTFIQDNLGVSQEASYLIKSGH